MSAQDSAGDIRTAGRLATAGADVVVIGAGAVGAWCALSLARAGRSVLVLEERADAATRATFGNAGLITVSAAAPLATPGIMAQGIRWSLQPRGPVRVRPRASRRWAAWVWHFRRACDPQRAARATAVSLRLVRRSAALLDDLVQEAESDFAYRHAGLVACFVDPQAFQRAVDGLDRYRQAGIEARVLDAAGVRAASPLAGPAVVGGVLYPEDAALDPAAMTRTTLDGARALGAEVAMGVRALGLAIGPDGHAILETSDGPLRAQEIVVSAGFGSSKLLAGAGPAPLIEAGKGYSDDLALSTPLHGPSLRLAEARVVATPLGDRLRVTSRLDLGDSTETTVQGRADNSLRAARRYLDPDRPGQRVRAPWTGLRPLTPDGLPLLGRHPQAANVVVATGHGQLGVSHAPATGELVAQLIAGQDAGPILADLAPGRFGRPCTASSPTRSSR